MSGWHSCDAGEKHRASLLQDQQQESPVRSHTPDSSVNSRDDETPDDDSEADREASRQLVVNLQNEIDYLRKRLDECKHSL